MSAHAYIAAIDALEPARRLGHVRRVSSGRVEAAGPMASIGDLCEIACRGESGATAQVLAEVAAVGEHHIVLIPLDQTATLAPDARVEARPARSRAPVGDCFAGRAVDALGEPIDGGAPLFPEAYAPLNSALLATMDRVEPEHALDTGLRAIDGLLTLGQGQRIGIFSASGVGKTTLMRQLAAQIACDRVVLCLVGERGREVEGAWREFSARTDSKRFTCVAATSDVSPVLRTRAVHQALCIAEYWRDKGEHVLLIVDSATRLAMALREIGLAAGAPPTLRAYTPNVFAALPRVVERCGASRQGGAITAIITVLSETDNVDDPIVEVMKSLLDGHIILSRELAEQGHFPAIDIPRSVSRHAPHLMAASHALASRRALALLSTFEASRMMIESGIYKAGASPRVDEALREREGLLSFLSQRADERAPMVESLRQLQLMMSRVKAHA